MPKSIPQRQCVGCREKKPKPELIRVVRAPDGAFDVPIPAEIYEQLAAELEVLGDG